MRSMSLALDAATVAFGPPCESPGEMKSLLRPRSSKVQDLPERRPTITFSLSAARVPTAHLRETKSFREIAISQARRLKLTPLEPQPCLETAWGYTAGASIVEPPKARPMPKVAPVQPPRDISAVVYEVGGEISVSNADSAGDVDSSRALLTQDTAQIELVYTAHPADSLAHLDTSTRGKHQASRRSTLIDETSPVSPCTQDLSKKHDLPWAMTDPPVNETACGPHTNGPPFGRASVCSHELDEVQRDSVASEQFASPKDLKPVTAPTNDPDTSMLSPLTPKEANLPTGQTANSVSKSQLQAATAGPAPSEPRHTDPPLTNFPTPTLRPRPFRRPKGRARKTLKALLDNDPGRAETVPRKPFKRRMLSFLGRKRVRGVDRSVPDDDPSPRNRETAPKGNRASNKKAWWWQRRRRPKQNCAAASDFVQGYFWAAPAPACCAVNGLGLQYRESRSSRPRCQKHARGSGEAEQWWKNPRTPTDQDLVSHHGM